MIVLLWCPCTSEPLDTPCHISPDLQIPALSLSFGSSSLLCPWWPWWSWWWPWWPRHRSGSSDLNIVTFFCVILALPQDLKESWSSWSLAKLWSIFPNGKADCFFVGRMFLIFYATTDKVAILILRSLLIIIKMKIIIIIIITIWTPLPWTRLSWSWDPSIHSWSPDWPQPHWSMVIIIVKIILGIMMRSHTFKVFATKRQTSTLLTRTLLGWSVSALGVMWS